MLTYKQWNHASHQLHWIQATLLGSFKTWRISLHANLFMLNRINIVEGVIIASAIKTDKDKLFTYILYYTTNTVHKIVSANF